MSTTRPVPAPLAALRAYNAEHEAIAGQPVPDAELVPYVPHVLVQPYGHGRGVMVSALWHVDYADGRGLDRQNVGGFLVKDDRMAARLKAAMLAGAVYYDPEVLTDVDGHTYVHARSHVLGRYMNADLRKLGF